MNNSQPSLTQQSLETPNHGGKQPRTAAARLGTNAIFEPAVARGVAPTAVAPEYLVTSPPAAVTLRAFALGILLSAFVAGLNSWIEIQADVHFLGGVQMPFVAVFGVLFFVLFVNAPLRLMTRVVPWLQRVVPVFSPTEILTIYAMLLFAALISTPGTYNFFLTTGPSLFYFSTGENRWADRFYEHIPPHFAPGWNGKTYQQEVIEPFYSGGLSLSQIPWHAWVAMLMAWSVLLLLVYATLFFMSLLFRRQWIENEALTFPLVQLPLQMVDQSGGAVERGFWKNRVMWTGFALATFFHLLRGLNNYFPDWPQISAFQGNAFPLTFTENPWAMIGTINTEYFFGAIGIAFLLTRELSFSFWFFFLLFKLQLVFVTMLGFPAESLPKDAYLGRPAFLTWQSVGGWLMMAVLLLWTARSHLATLWHEAVHPNATDSKHAHEPFSARFVILGLLLSSAGVMAWCWYSGINPVAALLFFTLFALASLVLARLVVEGGMLFPQLTFAPLEVLTGGFMGAGAIGAASLTKLSFMQPMLFSDMKTNLLPGFLHTLKISHDLGLERRQSRRLMLAVATAIIVSLAVTVFATVATLYSAGGLSGYKWFTQTGTQSTFKNAATMLKQQPGIEPLNWVWLSSGGALVWLMAFARARFLWFPLHPLAFLISTGYPISRLWFSFFVGWIVKSLLLRFGGQDSVARVRPFMIGLILGNVAAMMAWMIFGFFWGTQISYWSA
jgi:hypothetical protein